MPRKSAETTGNGIATDQERESPAAEAENVVAEVSVNAGPSNRPTLASEMLRADAANVAADQVVMEQAGAEHITAERVMLNNSGARTIEAKSAQVDRSGVLAVQSDKAVFYNSTVVAVAAEEARIVRGRVLLMKAESASFEGDVRIGVYAGPDACAVRPLLDVPGAAAVGAGMGVASVVLGAILRRIFRVR